MKIDENQLEKIMKNLELTKEEAMQVLLDDYEVDKMSNPNSDLSKEQQKNVKSATITHTRKGEKGKPKVRKANAEKGNIIDKVFNLLTQFTENCKIENAERQISFSIGENDYEFTLVQKRKKRG